MRRYILIGPSDERKTFAMKMKDDFRLTVIDCGALLRNEMYKGGSDMEKLAK